MSGMAREEVVGNEAAAARVKLKPATWRKYVHEGAAPQPHRRENVKGHALPVWYAYVLDAWAASRPGVPGRPRKARAERTA